MDDMNVLWWGLGLTLLIVWVCLWLPHLRLSPWVWKDVYGTPSKRRFWGRRCYAVLRGKPGTDNRVLWAPCWMIVPGLWVAAGTPFWLDAEGFRRLWWGWR